MDLIVKISKTIIEEYCLDVGEKNFKDRHNYIQEILNSPEYELAHLEPFDSMMETEVVEWSVSDD